MSTVQEPKYKLDRFEGPLDLLLSLVEKNKINIDDIPISLLCGQYMEYISAAQEMDVELSAEFIVMASELMLIKSRMLLPRNEETEEDPRASLAAAMLEYQRAKKAAAQLAQLYAQYGGRMTKDTDEIKADNSVIAEHDMHLLTKVMLRMLTEVRVSDEEVISRFDPLLRKPAVSVASAAAGILQRLRSDTACTLHSLFTALTSRSARIASFMAILELLKAGAVLLTEAQYAPDGIIRATEDVCLSLNPSADENNIAQILKEHPDFASE